MPDTSKTRVKKNISETSSDEDENDADAIRKTRPTKVNILDDGGSSNVSPVAIQCGLTPHRHPIAFATVEDFEIHHAKEHTNRCSSCGKNFATAHFLTLHIDEHHNPVREALEAKGEKTYACFVEDCERKCSSPQKRRMHLIDKHMFPKAYNFHVIETGIDKASTMLRDNHRRRVSTSSNLAESNLRRVRGSDNNHTDGEAVSKDFRKTPMQSQPGQLSKITEKDRPIVARKTAPNLKSKNKKITANDTIDDLEQSMSALSFIPPSVLKRMPKSNY